MPLEPFCNALIINSIAGNKGVVTVGYFLGRIEDNTINDWWEVDRSLLMVEATTRRPQPPERRCQGSMLMRIDGYEPTAEDLEVMQHYRIAAEFNI